MVCTKRVLCCLALLAIVILFVLSTVSSCEHEEDHMTSLEPMGESTAPTPPSDELLQYFSKPSSDVTGNNAVFTVKPPSTQEEKKAIDQFGKQMAGDIGKNTFNVKDFLPQEINAEWFQTDLSSATETLDAAALIDISKYCSGVDTVGQSLKNPSYDIRGNIPNPKIVVSPFLNSSYDPDTNIKPWC